MGSPRRAARCTHSRRSSCCGLSCAPICLPTQQECSVCLIFHRFHGLLSHTLALQLEDIAIDPHAEDGKGSIGSTQALNMDFTQTQATQGTSAPKVTCASDPVLSTRTRALILGGCKCKRLIFNFSYYHNPAAQAQATDLSNGRSRLLGDAVLACIHQESVKATQMFGKACVCIVEQSRKSRSSWPERVRFALQAKLTMAERRMLMDSFVKGGWLISTPGEAGRYSIGVRDMLSLGSLRLSARTAVVLCASPSVRFLRFACSDNLTC